MSSLVDEENIAKSIHITYSLSGTETELMVKIVIKDKQRKVNVPEKESICMVGICRQSLLRFLPSTWPHCRGPLRLDYSPSAHICTRIMSN